MGYENGGLSASDVALIQDRNNGGFGNSFGGDGAWWIVLFLIFALGGWNNGGSFGGGGFGGGGGANEYAWLSNGQKEIMQNTNDGFNTLQLANQLTGITSQVQGLSTQLCNCCRRYFSTTMFRFCRSKSNCKQWIRKCGNCRKCKTNG